MPVDLPVLTGKFAGLANGSRDDLMDIKRFLEANGGLNPASPTHTLWNRLDYIICKQDEYYAEFKRYLGE